MFAQLGPLLAPLAGRRRAGRRGRPQEAAHRPHRRAGAVLRPARPGRRCSATTRRRWLLVARHARHRHRQRPVRADLQRHAPVLVPREDLRRRHLAQLGADERQPGHRPGHRRLPVRPVGASWVFLLNAAQLRRPSSPCCCGCRCPQPVPSRHRRASTACSTGSASPGTTRSSAAASSPSPPSRCSACRSSPRCRRSPPRTSASRPKSAAYGLLYAAFGLGAVVGALSIGTVFAGVVEGAAHPLRAARPSPAFLTRLRAAAGRRRRPTRRSSCLGAVYFAVITSLSTVLQQDLDDSVRGQVMALWIMGFGGTVPDRRAARRPHRASTSASPPVMLGGAAVAVGLAAYAQLERGAGGRHRASPTAD